MSNLIEIKVIDLGVMTITAGIMVFPVSYIINDCLVDVYGFRKARFVIWLGFAMRDDIPTAKECWVTTNRSKTLSDDSIHYVEVAETALCFGWIDSSTKRLPDGRLARRISPRRKGIHLTDNNLRRCQKMIEQGLMTQAGIDAMPK